MGGTNAKFLRVYYLSLSFSLSLCSVFIRFTKTLSQNLHTTDSDQVFNNKEKEIEKSHHNSTRLLVFSHLHVVWCFLLYRLGSTLNPAELGLGKFETVPPKPIG